MDYDQLKEALRDALQEHFYGNAEVYFSTVEKTNATNREVIILQMEGKSMHPTIYLEDMYRNYQQTGELERYVKGTIQVCEGTPLLDVRKIPRNWNAAKPKVRIRVINKEWNAEVLKTLPHIEYLNLAVTFCAVVEEEQEMTATLHINEEVMKQWEIDLQTLWLTAWENLRKEEFVIETIESAMGNMFMEMACPDGGQRSAEQEEIEKMIMDNEGTGQLYVMLNQCRNYGGRAILRNDLFREFAEKQGTGFYILPCSVHELLLLKDDSAFDVKELKRMVCEINQCAEIINPEERLSDSIYYYDRKKGKVEIVA